MPADSVKAIYQEDLVQSISDALQIISYCHPPDFVKALRRAHDAETHAPARDAMAQLLINSRLSYYGKRPLCQDTGVVQVFLRLGVEIQWIRRDGQRLSSLQALVNEAVHMAYTNLANPLRATMIRDPLGTRSNTCDNTPGIVQVELTDGDLLEVLVVAKGGGGDVKARFATLNPSDSVADWVLDQLPGMGAGWCPPGILGIGIGGSPEQAMLLAKQSLFTPIDIDLVRQRGAASPEEELRLTLHQGINALGIGAQGLGGLATVLDVKVATAPCHAATIPVALVPNCAATRYLRFTLSGSGSASLALPSPEVWDGIPDRFDSPQAVRVNLDVLNTAEVATWRAGQTLLLSGRVLTGRDAAHKRLVNLLAEGKPLPVDLRGRCLYYVGPVDAVAGEAVGPAGPTTATRMDKFVDALLTQTGMLAMIGKAERGPAAIAAIKKHGAAYLVAVGGAAYLLSKAIIHAKVLAFDDLGMEAIHEFELKDFPVTVAVDTLGRSVHRFMKVEYAPRH
jgi:fumarate hydratase, class I